MICSQPDFIKVIARFQVDPQVFMIYGRLLSSKIYFFAAFHLVPTAGEPEIFTVSKPFAIFSIFFFADSVPTCYSNNVVRIYRATLSVHFGM